MPLQDITALPTAPARSDAPEVFIERADAFVAALPGLVTEINTLGDQLELTAALINAAPAYADAGLVALAGLTPAADKVPYWTSSTTSATMTVTSFARSLLDDTTAGAVLTTLGVSAFAQTILDDANAAAVRTTLGLGTAALSASGDFQPADAELTALAGLTSAANKLPYFTGSGTAAVTDVTSFARTLLDDADQAAMQATLGLTPSALSGGATSGKVQIGPLTLTWRDHTFSGSSSYAYGDGHTYSSWARAWIEGEDSGGGDASCWVTSAGLSSANVTNGGSGSSGYQVLFAIGV